ncbi:MAG: guanylate kinase [Gammaproteobacteria bacterium WSBS_2016_MAG_OTU1]
MNKLDSINSPNKTLAHKSGGRLFVISAPSGTGKTTITNRLRKMELVHVSISHTTRPPREGEIDGKQYFFVSRDKFTQMRENNAFLEWAEVYGQFYGTRKQEVAAELQQGHNVLLEIDVQGALSVQKIMPEAVLIFIRPPSLEELAARIRKRNTDSPEAIERRLAAAEEEIKLSSAYKYVIINHMFEHAVDEICHIIAGDAKDAK